MTLEDIQLCRFCPWNCLWLPSYIMLVEQTVDTKMATSERFQFHIKFRTIEKKKKSNISPWVSIELWIISNCANFIFKIACDFPYMQARRTNFLHENGYFWKVPISHMIPSHRKKKLFSKSFIFNLTVEHIQLCKFPLWNSHVYRLVEQTFSTKMTISERFQIQIRFKTIK